MIKYQTILFDFDGVLCKDYFYNNLLELYPDVYSFIQTKIFWGESDLPHKWMRNELGKNDINTYISNQTGIDYIILTSLFEESVRRMRINENLLMIAKELKNQWKNIALVTNNMDVFNEITIEHNHLNDIFPLIINSCDYGMMKHEQDWKLFDITMEKIWCNDYGTSLLIDDSKMARSAFEQKWGNTFAYSDFDEFYDWAKKNLHIQIQ